MSLVTVSAGVLGPYSGPETNLLLRIYCRWTFTPLGGTPILRGDINTDEFYQELACTVSDNEIHFPSFVIAATTDGAPNVSYYAFALYKTNGSPIPGNNVAFARIRIEPTPDTTTWADILATNQAVCAKLGRRYVTLDWLLAYFETRYFVVKATEIIYGIVRLSAPMDDPLAPTVVSVDDPHWKGILDVRNLWEWNNDLVAAVTALGSVNPVELEITEEIIEIDPDLIDPLLVDVDGNYVVPKNITVRCRGYGGIRNTNAVGKKVIISTFDTYPQKRCFYGPGTVVVKYPSEKWIEWWTGPGQEGINYHSSILAARESLLIGAEQAGQGGGVMRAGEGVWAKWNCTIPNLSLIDCAGGNDPVGGVYDPNTRNGTIWQYATIADVPDPEYAVPIEPAVKAVWSLEDVYRWPKIRNCNINVYGTPDAKYILWDSVTSSSFGFHMQHVGLRSDVAPATDGLYFDGHGSAETIGNVIEGCWVQMGNSPSYADPRATFYADSANASFHFKGVNTFECGVNSDAIRTYRRPFMIFDLIDPRGQNPDPIVYSTTKQRDIALASVTASVPINTVLSKITLDPATPADKQFMENDLGNRVYFDAGLPTEFEAYVFEFLSPFEAYLSFHPDAPIVNQACEVHRWNDIPGKAHAVFNCVGESRSLIVNGGADEGFLYSGIFSGNLDFPDKFVGYKSQGKWKYTGNANQTFDGCAFLGLAFHDLTAGPILLINFVNDCFVDHNTAYGDVLIRQGELWGTVVKSGTSLVTRRPEENCVKQRLADDLIALSYTNNWISRQNKIDVATMWEDSFDDPVRGIYDYVNRNGSLETAQKNLLEIGLWDELTKKPLYVYRHKRHCFNGDYEITGNQAENYRRFNVDMNLKSLSIELGIKTVALTGNLDFVTLDRHYHTIIFTGASGFAIGGIFININGQTFRDNEHFEIINATAGTLDLIQEWVPAPAVARFASDIEATVVLRPNERVSGLYDSETNTRLRIFSHKDRDAEGLSAYLDSALVTRNNTVTLANTPYNATFTRPGAYRVELDITSVVPTRGLKLAFVCSGTVVRFVGEWEAFKIADETVHNVTYSGDATIAYSPAIDFDTRFKFRGTIYVSTTGVLTLQAAQHTAHVSNTTIELGGSLKLEKLRGV